MNFSCPSPHGSIFRSLQVAAVALALIPVAPAAGEDSSSPPKPEIKPAPVTGYQIHADGGLIYDPLRREAELTGQLRAYADAATEKTTVLLGASRLEISVPTNARAYDVVPVPYTLYPGEGTAYPVAVESTAFEEEAKRKGRDLFDLSLPGKIEFGVEYLGSVTAHLDPAEKQNITADFTDKPGVYPNFHSAPLQRSGVVEAGDLVWFKFRLTNTGNTIFDAEGLGGGQLVPELLRKDAQGVFQPFAKSYNLYYRNLTYWYPGETWEPWIIFSIPKAGMPPEHYHLDPGEYKVRLRVVSRSYQQPDSAVNYWDGIDAFVWEMPITVEPAPRMAAVAEGSTVPVTWSDAVNKLPTFIHTFEQFMTAFDCHLKPPAADREPIKGVLHLQVAPWTKQVVVRLITGKTPAVATRAIPIRVDSAPLVINLPKKLPHVVPGADGRAEPVFFSQTMADMRTNVQEGPTPEVGIVDKIRQMKQLGVNVVATTSMPWLYDDRHGRAFNYAGDALKYALEVLRKEHILVEAWGSYPFDRGDVRDLASWITKKDYGDMARVMSGYGDASFYVSSVEKRLPQANAAILGYHLHRWGDLFFQEADGTVPISTEDTRGWMRDDLAVRFPIGPQGTAVFRQWLEAKYQSVEKLNAAWGSTFAAFAGIDPETYKADRYGQRWAYGDASHPFHDWNKAVEDYDHWRTEIRMQNYRDYLAAVQSSIPKPKVMFRTEGGNAIVAGLNPTDANTHFRHAFYSQRRLGAIAEVIDQAGLVGYHADYTTLPYTPSELRKIVRASVSQGITPVYLAQFNNMRDIAVNDLYGRSYQQDYNLDTPRKGIMMHVLTAAYPWFKIMVEEGGIPGLLWEDLECDGVVTETQQRELRFYQDKLKQALDAMPASARQYVAPPQDWRPPPIHSYQLPAPPAP